MALVSLHGTVNLSMQCPLPLLMIVIDLDEIRVFFQDEKKFVREFRGRFGRHEWYVFNQGSLGLALNGP